MFHDFGKNLTENKILRLYTTQNNNRQKKYGDSKSKGAYIVVYTTGLVFLKPHVTPRKFPTSHIHIVLCKP